MTTKEQSYLDNEKQLKNYKLDKYKIDKKLKLLYKSTPNYDATLPINQLNLDVVNNFFVLMQDYQCDNFAIYYENNYEIKKIINLISQQELNLTFQHLIFLKQFFSEVNKAIITWFDLHVKPAINNTTDSSVNNSNTNTLYAKSGKVLN